MKNAQLVRSEIRRLTTTRMPLAFLVVLGAMAALNAAVVTWGADADGTQTFLSTALDQQSLIAFSANSVIIAGLFGATAVATPLEPSDRFLTVSPTLTPAATKSAPGTIRSAALALPAVPEDIVVTILRW